MPKYRIFWYDFEQKRYGEPLELEAESITDAYINSLTTLKGSTIEFIGDETGKKHSKGEIIQKIARL